MSGEKAQAPFKTPITQDTLIDFLKPEHADFIVTVINCHEALVEALEQIAEGRAEFDMDNYKFACNVIEANRRVARAALALAKGELK